MITQIGEADNLSRNLREKPIESKSCNVSDYRPQKRLVINTYVWQSDTEGGFTQIHSWSKTQLRNQRPNVKQISLLSKKLSRHELHV